ncbi:MAG: hypothetical protein HQ581_12965 [Planctomycetes bacterium]|nr:hypothetical protein [Planctomycetota bacterium]
MEHLSFDPIGGNYWLTGGAVAVLAGLLVLGPARSRTTRPRRAALAGIRVLVILLVAVAMARPVVVYTEWIRQPAVVFLMLDQSRSMKAPDARGGATRWDALRATLADGREDLARLAKEVQIKVLVFDSHAAPVELVDGEVELPDQPDGDQTAIGSVLEELPLLAEGHRVLGVILLSDGAQQARPPRATPPQTAVARTRHLGFPLFPLGFGRSSGLGQAADVAVESLSVEETVFVKSDLQVAAVLRFNGYVNRTIPVELRFETAPGVMEVVDRKPVAVTADGQIINVEFSHTVTTRGEHKVEVRVAEQPGELVTTNNSKSTFVNVLKGGLNVLYLEGTPRAEQKFLRRTLDSSPEIKVDYQWLDARRPGTYRGDFLEQFKPGKYDVYIIGDLDSNAFLESKEMIGAAQASQQRWPALESLAEAVDRGAGLIMLGGFHSFGPGGYYKTPLAGVLPVRMHELDRQQLDGPIREQLHHPGPLRIQPTPRGREVYGLMLAADPAEDRELWSKLPPLEGANRFRGFSAGAEKVATTDKGIELLVAHSPGNGRVMAFAADSTWLWWMGGFETAHKRFWRQIVLWLAKKDQSMDSRVWVKLQGRSFGPQEKVAFTLGADSPDGDPILDATFEVKVLDPQGDRHDVRPVVGTEQVTGSFLKTKHPGDYTVEVSATKVIEGLRQPLGKTTARFVVVEEDLELDNAAADVDTLESLAQMSGGQYYPPEMFPQLLQELAEKVETLEVPRDTSRELWSNWPFFLLFVALLGVEWFLRKRWGLV